MFFTPFYPAAVAIVAVDSVAGSIFVAAVAASVAASAVVTASVPASAVAVAAGRALGPAAAIQKKETGQSERNA